MHRHHYDLWQLVLTVILFILPGIGSTGASFFFLGPYDPEYAKKIVRIKSSVDDESKGRSLDIEANRRGWIRDLSIAQAILFVINLLLFLVVADFRGFGSFWGFWPTVRGPGVITWTSACLNNFDGCVNTNIWGVVLLISRISTIIQNILFIIVGIHHVRSIIRWLRQRSDHRAKHELLDDWALDEDVNVGSDIDIGVFSKYFAYTEMTPLVIVSLTGVVLWWVYFFTQFGSLIGATAAFATQSGKTLFYIALGTQIIALVVVILFLILGAGWMKNKKDWIKSRKSSSSLSVPSSLAWWTWS